MTIISSYNYSRNITNDDDNDNNYGQNNLDDQTMTDTTGGFSTYVFYIIFAALGSLILIKTRCFWWCCYCDEDDNENDNTGITSEEVGNSQVNMMPSDEREQYIMNYVMITKFGRRQNYIESDDDNSTKTIKSSHAISTNDDIDGVVVLSNIQCAICLEKFELDDDVISSLYNHDCCHIFHHECIIKWLQKNDDCPICRRDFLNTKSIIQQQQQSNNDNNNTDIEQQQQQLDNDYDNNEQQHNNDNNNNLED